MGHPDLSIKKFLRMVLGVLTIVNLKRISEYFFSKQQITACKIKDREEMANSLMFFNLLKIIHPFQGKKHLRTYIGTSKDM